jgi:hypothetical protein
VLYFLLNLFQFFNPIHLNFIILLESIISSVFLSKSISKILTFLSYNFFYFSERGGLSSFVLVDDDVVVDVVVSTITGSFDLDFSLN